MVIEQQRGIDLVNDFGKSVLNVAYKIGATLTGATPLVPMGYPNIQQAPVEPPPGSLAPLLLPRQRLRRACAFSPVGPDTEPGRESRWDLIGEQWGSHNPYVD